MSTILRKSSSKSPREQAKPKTKSPRPSKKKGSATSTPTTSPSASTSRRERASSPTPPSPVETSKQYSIFDAAKEGDVVKLTTLLNKGLGILGRDDEGNTILHVAASSNQEHFLSYVLGLKKIGVSMVNHAGKSSLHLAVTSGSVSCIAPLINAGADPSLPARDGTTPLKLAESRGGIIYQTFCEHLNLSIPQRSGSRGAGVGRAPNQNRRSVNMGSGTTRRAAEPSRRLSTGATPSQGLSNDFFNPTSRQSSQRGSRRQSLELQPTISQNGRGPGRGGISRQALNAEIRSQNLIMGGNDDYDDGYGGGGGGGNRRASARMNRQALNADIESQNLDMGGFRGNRRASARMNHQTLHAEMESLNGWGGENNNMGTVRAVRSNTAGVPFASSVPTLSASSGAGRRSPKPATNSEPSRSSSRISTGSTIRSPRQFPSEGPSHSLPDVGSQKRFNRRSTHGYRTVSPTNIPAQTLSPRSGQRLAPDFTSVLTSPPAPLLSPPSSPNKNRTRSPLPSRDTWGHESLDNGPVSPFSSSSPPASLREVTREPTSPRTSSPRGARKPTTPPPFMNPQPTTPPPISHSSTPPPVPLHTPPSSPRTVSPALPSSPSPDTLPTLPPPQKEREVKGVRWTQSTLDAADKDDLKQSDSEPLRISDPLRPDPVPSSADEPPMSKKKKRSSTVAVESKRSKEKAKAEKEREKREKKEKRKSSRKDKKSSKLLLSPGRVTKQQPSEEPERLLLGPPGVGGNVSRSHSVDPQPQSISHSNSSPHSAPEIQKKPIPVHSAPVSDSLLNRQLTPPGVGSSTSVPSVSIQQPPNPGLPRNYSGSSASNALTSSTDRQITPPPGTFGSSSPPSLLSRSPPVTNSRPSPPPGTLATSLPSPSSRSPPKANRQTATSLSSPSSRSPPNVNRQPTSPSSPPVGKPVLPRNSSGGSSGRLSSSRSPVQRQRQPNPSVAFSSNASPPSSSNPSPSSTPPLPNLSPSALKKPTNTGSRLPNSDPNRGSVSKMKDSGESHDFRKCLTSRQYRISNVSLDDVPKGLAPERTPEELAKIGLKREMTGVLLGVAESLYSLLAGSQTPDEDRQSKLYIVTSLKIFKANLSKLPDSSDSYPLQPGVGLGGGLTDVLGSMKGFFLVNEKGGKGDREKKALVLALDNLMNVVLLCLFSRNFLEEAKDIKTLHESITNRNPSQGLDRLVRIVYNSFLVRTSCTSIIKRSVDYDPFFVSFYSHCALISSSEDSQTTCLSQIKQYSTQIMMNIKAGRQVNMYKKQDDITALLKELIKYCSEELRRSTVFFRAEVEKFRKRMGGPLSDAEKAKIQQIREKAKGTSLTDLWQGCDKIINTLKQLTPGVLERSLEDEDCEKLMTVVDQIAKAADDIIKNPIFGGYRGPPKAEEEEEEGGMEELKCVCISFLVHLKLYGCNLSVGGVDGRGRDGYVVGEALRGLLTCLCMLILSGGFMFRV